MKIQFARYELKPARSLNRLAPEGAGAVRQGALIRVEFPGKGEGFADVHPWPELGDAPLEEQLQALVTGRTTALTRQSMHFADMDARARSAGRSLFEGLEIPPSHALVTDPAHFDEDALGVLATAGFDRIKLKAGRDLPSEAKRIRGLADKMPLGMKLRLDLNAGPGEAALESFLNDLGPEALARVDFIEDPMPWSAGAWAQVRRKHRVRLALDREIGRAQSASAAALTFRDAVDVLVVKPAVQRIEIASVPRVFTSYLDHPLGQVFAAFEAARTARGRNAMVETCGLLSHVAYSPNEYSERLRARGPRLLAPEGAGAGFGELLEKEDWKPLR